MGHISAKRDYLDLQRRLDRMPIGAPARTEFFSLLEELFTRDECRVAAAIPLRLSPVGRIARCAQMGEQRTQEILDAMVEKGLVIDIPDPSGEIQYFLNPPIVGFFEFTMMRIRTDIDQKKVAHLMWQYIREDPELAFMRMVAGGSTYIARPVVHEDVLEPEVSSEVLDYERASALIDSAGAWSEGICHCRHIKLHMDKRCDYPMEHCLSLGDAARHLIKIDHAKEISKERAMEVLAKSRDLGMVQMADNVKSKPAFICNCCKCCCEMMESFRTLPQQAKVVTSNYLAVIDDPTCTGCGKCAKACPIEVIDLVAARPTAKAKKRKKRAEVNASLCLGCGVCHRQCKFGALAMKPIGSRVNTPETMMEKMMVQALERGKLQNMIFDDSTKVTHRALSGFLGAILNLPPAKQILAKEQIRSKFINKLLEAV